MVYTRNYDVFLNHRGPDVKKGLASHIYAALKQVNFIAFVDNMEIQPGEEAWDAIKSAIKRSKVHIAVFSPGYVESMWCLDELHLLLECFRSSESALFLPIFYNVEPFDLRLEPPSRPSCYRPALQMLSTRYDDSIIQKWKQALYDASMISGFVFPDDFQGVEARLVEKIVGLVIDALSQQSLLSGPEHPVGLDEKLRDALEIMGEAEWDGTVRKMGICGMGGLGKSTLAKCIYNRIHREFDSACFIQNVSEGSKGINKGFRGLQKDMLQQLLHTKDISVPDTERGRQMIRDRLAGIKVLIILDDVSEKQQLDQLMPPRDCHLGKDSLIVLTTRDQQVLSLAQAHVCLSMDGLNREEARELFNLHASEDKTSTSFIEPRKEMPADFQRLREQVADACQGLPLALEVLGSHLRDKDLSEWEATANALASGAKLIDPQRKVTAILKISFNALGSFDEKEMFLDIACFLKGEHKDKGMRIWGSMYNDANAKLNLENLIRKCLVKLSKNGDFILHDLLCIMGREIVDDSHADYWERSHLWREDDVRRVLLRSKGTSHVRALGTNFQKTWETKSFAGMDELKLLILDNVTLTGKYTLLSQELRWLQLRHSPLETPLPFSDIGLDNVAVLDLEGSNFSSFDIDDCMLKSLKELNLKNCSNLKELPARFAEKSNHLEKLILSGCVSLKGFPEWIGKRSASLRYLDISSCRNVTNIPDGMMTLRALTYLLMNDCGGLTRLPSTIGQLKALEYIGLDRIPLDELPQSFSLLTSLKSLRLDHSSKLRELPSSIFNKLKWITSLDIMSCPLLSELPPSVTSLQSLRYLRVADCENIDQLPTDIYELWQLEELHVINLVKLSSLPSTLGSLPRVESLSLKGCSNLAKVEHLPSALTFLDVSGCTSVRCLNISGCRKLKTLSHGIESTLKSLTILLMHECEGLTGFPDAIPQFTTLQEIGFDSVPLKSYPKSFECLTNLSSLRFYSLQDLPALSSTIGNLIKLTSLEIISCRRISEIPQTVAKLQNLLHFRVIDCESLFQLPIIMGKIRHLEEFHVIIPLVYFWDDHKYGRRYCRRDCTIWDIGFPNTGYATFLSLKRIILKGVSATSLPEDFGRLPNLEELVLKSCDYLCKVSYLPASLVSLNLSDCASLKGMLPLRSLTRLRSLELCNCRELVGLDGLECLPLLSCLDITDCRKLNVLAGLEKCTSLESLFMARSGVSVLQDKTRPWIQKIQSLEVVSLSGADIPSYFLTDFQGYCRQFEVRIDVEDAWRLDIDVPESRKACKGILCCFVSKEKFDKENFAEVRTSITWASTWVRAEVEDYKGGGAKFSQVLFYNRVANWEDELHICIFRECHPLVESLKGGGCRLSVIARSVYELWSIEVSAGYVQLMYGENEMDEALQRLTLCQS
ncbi:hypothetical protein GOP47_0011186 [Adiantum capillus-veneris]|uniref:TIR domain-containing protein n=1 Tax=Adiantum capillus-veneris TaxID=13818 RepID=A0A9D4UTQ6_ADICA|nr:hypothetical protein GOP47_0011186 [Adiantum capillus-veneris]